MSDDQLKQAIALVKAGNKKAGGKILIRHLALGIISMMKGFQHIVTQAINCYNSGVHVFLRFVAVWVPSTLPETHGLFTSTTQGGILG